MPVDELRDHPWTRKHDDPRHDLIARAPRIVYPKSLAHLISLCRHRAPSERFRAAGSHWSLSQAAISDHTFIETNDPHGRFPALDRTLHEVVPGCLHPDLVERMAGPSFPTDIGTLVHVEAGKRIYQLYAELDQVDDLADDTTLGGYFQHHHGTSQYAGPWGLETLGGAAGQTIVGALTTGTHGGDFDRPPIADSVVAIHLVADGGRHYWIEASDERYHPQLVDDDQLHALYGDPSRGGCDNAPDRFEVIRDDAVFDAVLVSAGRFGVIYSVVLRAVPQYSLWERRRLHVWQAVREAVNERSSGLYVDTSVHAPGAPCRFLQVAVCLTPHAGFARNLVGVTKRWTIPVDHAPGGRAERIGTPVGGAPGQNLRFPNAGNSFPYSPDPDRPLLTEEPSLLDRACSNPSFLAGVLEEAAAEIEELVGSDGAAVGAAVAAVVAAGGSGLLALLPALAFFARVIRELLDEFGTDDRLGEHMERVKNHLLDPDETDPVTRAAGLFAWQLIAYKVFESMQGDLEFGALSFAVMDRKNYLDVSCEHNVDSVEVFFDATDDRLVAFVDALIAFEINQELHGKAFLGYASLRFTGPTRALIGMQKHATTCSIEVAGLRDVSGTQELIEYAERLALNPNIGGILHWGQRNHAGRAQVEARFGGGPANPGGDLDTWRQALDRITDGGRWDGFSNEFTRRAGLEPA